MFLLALSTEARPQISSTQTHLSANGTKADGTDQDLAEPLASTESSQSIDEDESSETIDSQESKTESESESWWTKLMRRLAKAIVMEDRDLKRLKDRRNFGGVPG